NAAIHRLLSCRSIAKVVLPRLRSDSTTKLIVAARHWCAGKKETEMSYVRSACSAQKYQKWVCLLGDIWQSSMTEKKEFTDRAEAAADSTELPGGSVFAGRYKILNLIGSGGMGSVYKALDLTLNRHVALKMLHRELVPDEYALLRFQNEARATSRVKSPGVV